MITLGRFFVLRGACATAPPALRPPWPGVDAGSMRCWRVATVALCCASAQRCTDELRWTCIMAAAGLMVAAGTTTVDKSMLVTFVALQAPTGVGSAAFSIKEEHDRWMWIIPFLSLLVHLLYITAGYWRRAMSTTVLLGIAMVPSKVMNLRPMASRLSLWFSVFAYLAIYFIALQFLQRDNLKLTTVESQGRVILSSAIAVYLAFQHFTRAGSLRRAFSGVAIFATLCIVCMTTISLMLVF